jgi:DNA polymerase-3 subunit gamma/tau
MAQTLYRKYRSQRFAEIIGQDAVTRVLRNSVERDRLSHAYLFAGPRGTGKTSVARILAKAVNCERPEKGDACGACEVCTAIAAGNAVDVLEIDAASNRGIDDVRELRERVNYGPLKLRHKVYIIDEAHMITGPAFNALLKTLEEPPSHVIFCLCTTEAHKLPVTILSRCIRFDFHRLPSDKLAEHLTWIAGQEGFALSPDAADELARLAEGSARDAIGLLDQLTAYCEGEIALADITSLFQLGDPAEIPRMADLLETGPLPPLLEAWQTLARQGRDPGRFLTALAGELRTRYLTSPTKARRHALEALWQGANLLRFESFPALLVELALLQARAALRGERAEEERAPAPGEEAPGPPTASSILATDVREPESAAPPGGPPRPAQKEARAEQRPAAASPDWEAFLAALRRHVTTYSLVFDCLEALPAQGMLRLVFGKDQRQPYTYVQKEEHAQLLIAAAEDVFGVGTAVMLSVDGEPATVVRLARAAPVAPGRQEALPIELVAEVVDEPPETAPRVERVDPGQLADTAEAMTLETEISAKDSPAVTAHEVMSLFEATEIDEGEEDKSDETD